MVSPRHTLSVFAHLRIFTPLRVIQHSLSHQDLGKGGGSSNPLVGKTCSSHGPSSGGIQVSGDTSLPRPFSFTGRDVEQSPITLSASLSWVTELDGEGREGGGGPEARETES